MTLTNIIGADKPAIVDLTGKETQTEARAIDMQMLKMKNDGIQALTSIVKLANEYLDKLEKTNSLEEVVGIKVMFSQAISSVMSGDKR